VPIRVKIVAPKTKEVNRKINTRRFSPPIKILFKKAVNGVLGVLST
jgi:hypothetical protein